MGTVKCDLSSMAFAQIEIKNKKWLYNKKTKHKCLGEQGIAGIDWGNGVKLNQTLVFFGILVATINP